MAETELELKLSLPLEDFDRFRRDPLIHRAKTGRARSKALMAVYFDTPALDLRANRCALRIRQEGNARVQTLKLSHGGAGLQNRTEFNAPTEGDAPDLALFDDAETQEKIAALVGEQPLQPVFTTNVRRTIWDIALANGTVEVALDTGHIESNGARDTVAEIELELTSGDPTAILDLAAQIAERYDIHIHQLSKAARGYALFQQQPPVAMKAKKLKLNRDDPIWSSLGHVVNESSAHLFGNEAAILAGNDVDGIHQARVAVRRMRAALSAFRSVIPDEIRKPLAKPLQKLQVGLGPARDWDVFLQDTLYPLREELPANDVKALEKFILRVEEAKRRAYKQAFKVLSKAWYGRLQLALVTFPYSAAPTQSAEIATEVAAGALLDERLETVRLGAGNNPLELPEEALHAMRIDIKKLRYALDFLRSLYPSDVVAPWRRASKDLQDCLGGLNDTVVQAALLDAMEAPDRPVPKSVRKAILARNAARAESDLANLSECWDRFEALEPFWRGTPPIAALLPMGHPDASDEEADHRLLVDKYSIKAL